MAGTSIARPDRRERIKSPRAIKGTTDIIQMFRVSATKWSKRLKEADREKYAKSFMVRTIVAYWHRVHGSGKPPLPQFLQKIKLPLLDEPTTELAAAIGEGAERLEEMDAIYELGNVYTSLLPEATRTKTGVFYTPPALTSRLLDMAENAGVNWATARVVDPACGGGAFLAPVCARKLPHLRDLAPADIIKHIEYYVTGWEIDPFAAWLSQVFVEIVLRDILAEAAVNMKPLVQVCNSLESPLEGKREEFDLVIGNPPYGKVKLTSDIRSQYKGSLYGHPNLYGLFTHLATELVNKKGVVALLTPTSFLSGEYFKHLRRLLRDRTQPVEIDFVDTRKGVFDGVLQETMLAVYQIKRSRVSSVKINELTATKAGGIIRVHVGTVKLPAEYTAPWIIARSPDQMATVDSMGTMSTRLKDWGYTVSTGPLVWNRHKPQLKKQKGTDHLPVVWAESIRQDGRFEFRAEKLNHQPYFKVRTGDDWLVLRKPCILLQRTTAKEQEKRLIAAALPSSFLRKGVVIENHLNMILPSNGKPPVDPDLLSVFLNSRAANHAFKAITGSVAVSAYELESFPLPDLTSLQALAAAVKDGLSKDKLEHICYELYSIEK